jgi:dihydroorotate dehydrogenase (fumarate)
MDLKTRYMGLPLDHPIVASSSPLSETLDGIRRLEDGGVAAVVASTLFEEQCAPAHADGKAPGNGNIAFISQPDDYFKLLQRASDSVRIPVIASLNCVSQAGWVNYAKALEQAGASAIELNLFRLETSLDSNGQDVEEHYLDCLNLVKGNVSIPVAVKLSPFFSAMGTMAKRLDEAGADALILFNRYYMPDFNIESLSVTPALNLSTATEIRLPLRWLALLHGKIQTSLAASTGVETSVEVIKYLLAGADTVMTTSTLLRKGPAHTSHLINGLTGWMERHEFNSIGEMRGLLSHIKASDRLPFEQVNYLHSMESYGQR